MILVLAATGRVGALVVCELLEAGAAVRCLVRDGAKARAALGKGPDLLAGALEDSASLDRAMVGVQALFLASPIEPALASLQLNAVNAARRAGVAHVVKLSGSDWTMTPGNPTRVGATHAEVEHAIVDAGLEHTFIRPNAFLQTMLGAVPAQVRAQDAFSLATGDARISFTDIRDIAAVAAHALAARPAGSNTHVLSGPVAWSGADLAEVLSRRLARTVTYRSVSIEESLARLQAAGESAYILQHRREVLERIALGAARSVSPTIERLLGRPARHPLQWLEETLPLPAVPDAAAHAVSGRPAQQ